MSPKVAPGRTASIPFISASCVTCSSRCALSDGLPATYIRLVSPNHPFRITVTSIFRISPSLRLLSPGMP